MKKQAGCNPKSSDKFWKLLSQALPIDPGICFRITLLTCMVLIKISKLCNSELLSIHDGKICLLIKLFPGTVFLICHLVLLQPFVSWSQFFYSCQKLMIFYQMHMLYLTQKKWVMKRRQKRKRNWKKHMMVI